MKSNKISSYRLHLLALMTILIFCHCSKTDSTDLSTLSTTIVTNITPTKATSGGNITDDGGAVLLSRGVCWSTNPNPTIADSKTDEGAGLIYPSQIFGLIPNTTYHVRAYATNNAGTAYGNDLTFTTISASIIIGTQEWMVENLEVTSYRNGDPIANVMNGPQWSNLSTGAYADYDNSAAYGHVYGHLYNWYAVHDSRNICPSGWHVPSLAEWATLIDFLGGSSVAGGKMKEIGLIHWTTPNSGATNESGFSALPGGYRDEDGTFAELQTGSRLWTSTEDSADDAYLKGLLRNDAGISELTQSKKSGLSVRCIKD